LTRGNDMSEALGRSERRRVVRIGLAVTIAAALLTGTAPARAGSLDNPPPGAAATASQVAVAEPAAASLSGSSAIDPISSGVDLADFLKPGTPVEQTRAA